MPASWRRWWTIWLAELGVDPNRVFAAGVSNGGSMALRLALEQPEALPRGGRCAGQHAGAGRTSSASLSGRPPSAMILNGTEDPLVPYAAARSACSGCSTRVGAVLSSTESAQYLADRNRLAGKPRLSLTPTAQGHRVEHARWQAADGRTEVELVTLHGAGHGASQPWAQRPPPAGAVADGTQRACAHLGLL